MTLHGQTLQQRQVTPARKSARISSITQAVRAAVATEENVQRHLAGQTVRKVVFVPGRLINFVVG